MTAMDEGGRVSREANFWGMSEEAILRLSMAIPIAADAQAKALNRIADAIELLARATAGEFDAGDEERLPRWLGER